MSEMGEVARQHIFYDYMAEERFKYTVKGETPPQLDIPLLRKGVEWVETESLKPVKERRWFQGWWRAAIRDEKGQTCGTAYCLAGYVAELDPAFEWASDAESYLGAMLDIPWLRRLEPEGYVGAGVEGREVYTARERAQELLGITKWEAEALFTEGNSAKMIRGIAEEICRSRGEELGL